MISGNRDDNSEWKLQKMITIPTEEHNHNNRDQKNQTRKQQLKEQDLKEAILIVLWIPGCGVGFYSKLLVLVM